MSSNQSRSEQNQNAPECSATDQEGAQTDSDDDCEFFDATSDVENLRRCEMDLDNALEEVKLAICYFFNNNFDEARSLLRSYADSSMYHSMGHAVFMFLEAILTFEQQHIITASEELKKCLEMCHAHRRKSTITQSIGKKFMKTNYNQFTDVESHAELCFGEALLLRALLTFIEDETLSSLIRGGMKIRQCYSSYKECAEILKQRQWKSDVSRVHFESGVRMGIGTFNLMISLLPTKVIRILEFIGFSGDETAGLDYLNAGYQVGGLRQILCVLTLLFYHLFICYFLSHKEGDLELCQEILTKQLQTYPNGVFFLFFKGRLEFMKGNLEEAQFWYKKSWKSQNSWIQFHHLSFWELFWVNCLKLDWQEAGLYATYLLENNKWSRTIYSYQKAAAMLMMDNITESDRCTIDGLMQDTSRYKQRIAGKSLPMEKFICKKAERYFAQSRTLCLPALELMYVWNVFNLLGKHYQLADSIYQLIESKILELKAKSVPEVYDVDNYVLCLLLRGACYRQMRNTFLALQDLEECRCLQNKIQSDTYLVAYAAMEIALVHADDNNIELALSTLEEARKKYTGYSLHSRLHFRIHAALMELRERQLKIKQEN